MPLYSYECILCETVFDVAHSMTETLEECPGCKLEGGLTKLVNIISSPDIIQPKAGDIVKEAIKDAHKEIKIEMEGHRREKQ